MSNLFSIMSASSSSLDAFQQALSTTQNNISNASTPGYAKQTLNLQAQPFDTAGGLAGGVAAQGLTSSRDQYAEEAVQQQSQTLGLYSAQAQSTATLQSFFDVTGTSGISTALTNLFSSFSAWSVTPNDATARQTVLSSASAAASAINGLSNSLTQSGTSLDGQISDTVGQIDSIAQQIQQYNAQKLQSPGPDAGADAQLHSALDSLSQLVNFSTVTQSDGTVAVMLAGGTPLVMGKQAYPLSSNASVSATPPPVNALSPPTAHVLDSQGNDITNEITSGKLGGLLDSRNRVLASVIGDSQQQGTLNQLAQGLADTVNLILESGRVSSDPGAVSGSALFTYDALHPTNVAASLALSPTMTAGQLAAVDSSGNANGNAQQLAALADPTGATGTIGGQSMIQYYGNIAAAVGQENSVATANQQTQQQVLANATSLRDQISGVSLNQEAVNVMQFQQAYQAVSQVLTVLGTLSNTIINLIQPA